MATFNCLPDNIILEIFGYLPVKDLCLAGRVNKRFRRIVRDNTLWRNVDLTPYKLDLSKMWKVIRSHLSDILVSMKIKGFSMTSGPKQKKHSMSTAMLNDLAERCPNIKTFHLNECSTENLNCKDLPSSLTSLSICSSVWQPRWFKWSNSNSVLLPHLRVLDLSGSRRVDNFDLEDISQWSDLEELVLNGCYRLNQNGWIHLSNSLTKLKRLEISGTTINELSFHHISRNLKCLEVLNIAKCNGVTDSCLEEISCGLKNLCLIDVSSCTDITIAGVKTLVTLRNLQNLVMKNVNLTENDIVDVTCKFTCTIDY